MKTAVNNTTKNKKKFKTKPNKPEPETHEADARSEPKEESTKLTTKRVKTRKKTTTSTEADATVEPKEDAASTAQDEEGADFPPQMTKRKKLRMEKVSDDEMLVRLQDMLPAWAKAPAGFNITKQKSYVATDGTSKRIGVWIGKRSFYTYDAEKTPQGAESSNNAKGGINFRLGLGLNYAWGLALEACTAE